MINKIETILASFYLTLYNLRLVYYTVPIVKDTCQARIQLFSYGGSETDLHVQKKILLLITLQN